MKFYSFGMKIESLTIDDENYPAILREVFCTPKKLFYVGNLDVLRHPKVAIVGTRRSSAYGESQAFKIAKELSQRGICVVSGLAYGIDAQAHKGALEGHGGTIAVLANGLPEIYPANNTHLAKRIVRAGGLLLSEVEFGVPPLKYGYLNRNRLISGLSLGVLVVEAPMKSGAMNTANHAVEQGREVMAIPGRVTDENSTGTNDLINRGANLITCSKQIADILHLSWQTVDGNSLIGVQKSLFDVLKEKPQTGAELGEHFEGKLREFYAALSELELKGYVKRMSDLRYAVCSE